MKDGDDKVERLFDEKKLASAVGVRRRHVARWRMSSAVREDHWKVVDGCVALTHRGCLQAGKDVGFSVSKRILEACLFEKKLAAVSVRVKLTPRNLRVCLCVRLDTNALATVQVRDNRVFRVHDEFDAVCTETGLAHYGRWPEAGW